MQCSAQHQAVRHHTKSTDGAARHAGCSGHMRPCVTARRRRQSSVGQVREYTGPAMPQHTYTQRAHNTHSPARLPVLLGRHPGLCHLVIAPSAHHSTTQRGAAQHSATRHATARHTTARRGTARHGTAEQGAAQQSGKHRGSARQSRAPHSTAHQSRVQHQGKRRRSRRLTPQKRKEPRPQPWDSTTPAHHARARGHRTRVSRTPPPSVAARPHKPPPEL